MCEVKLGDSDMRKIVPYDVFAEYVTKLEKRGVLVRTPIWGYKKTFRDVLLENKLVKQKGKADYVMSAIDGAEYCLTNGKFKTHLVSSGMGEKQYVAEKCGIPLPVGFALSFTCDGKQVKSKLLEMDAGRDLYFMYRSVVTSVSSDYRKMMLLYGISEDEAKKIVDEGHRRRSLSKSGRLNGSFGKTGIDSHCYGPFRGSKDPGASVAVAVQERIRGKVLRWASDNDIDETSYERLVFLYHSELFLDIQRAKGQEYCERMGVESGQGMYLYNRDKSLRCFSAKNFLEYCSRIINLRGNENEKKEFARLLSIEDYQGIMILAYSVRGMTGYKGRIVYESTQRGHFSLRSKLEKGFLYIADRLDDVSAISYESVKVPYCDGECARMYWIDFDVTMSNGRRVLVEVKPYNQCVIPEGRILAKKQAAERYALDNGCSYIFVTEKDMKYDLVHKKLQSA
jgi:hypothetical protein